MIMSIKSPINKYKVYWQLVRVVLFGKGVHGIEVYVPVRESDMVLLLSGKPGALWAVPLLFFSIFTCFIKF